MNSVNDTQRLAARLSPARLILQVMIFICALGLLAWCIRRAVPDEGIPALLERLRDTNPRIIAGLLLCTLGSVVVNGTLFWVIARATMPINHFSMQMSNLIVSVLNYAPIRIGVIVRYLHHRKIDGVDVLTVTGWYATMGIVILLSLASMALATLSHRQLDPAWFGLFVVFTLVQVGMVVAVVRRPWIDRILGGALRPACRFWFFLAAVLLRIADIGFFGVRQHLAYRVWGVDLTAENTVIVTIVKMMVSLLPVGSLGFADVAGMLAGDMAQGSTLADAVGEGSAQAAQAMLLDRMAEMAVIVPLGAIALFWMRRQWVMASVPASTPG